MKPFRNILALVLCLAFILGSACASVSVRLDDGALLLSRDGTEIIPHGVYGDIAALDDGLFAALDGDAYALMDASGAKLTPALYGEMRLEGDVLLAKRDGLWGLLSRTGMELTPFDYTRIVPGGGKVFWAIRGEPDDVESDELFILSADGAEHASGLYVRRMADRASEGLLAVMPPDSVLWGYCDERGEMVIPDAYTHAGTFCGGRAVTVQNGGYMLIDARGNMILMADYDYMEISPSGFVLAARAMEGVWVFDLDGKQLHRYEGEETAAAPAGNGWAVYDGEWLRVYTAGGELIAELSQEGMVSEGLDGQLILSNGAWGEECTYLSGTDGLRRYQHIYPLGWAKGEPIYAWMQANSARYVNDLLGEIQYSVDMDSARYGVADGTGEVLIPAEYESISYLADDRLLLYVGGQWQLADARGRIYWSRGVRQIEESSF